MAEARDNRSVDLALAELAFSDRCCACAEQADLSAEVEYKRGVDLLVVSFLRTISIQVPICRACRNRWWKRFALIVAGLVGSIVGLIGLYAALFDDRFGQDGMVALVSVALLIMIWGRRNLDGWTDKGVFGIRIERYGWDTGRARIWFRDALLAAAMEAGQVDGLDAEPHRGRQIGAGGIDVGLDDGVTATQGDPGPVTKQNLAWLNRKTGKGFKKCQEALESADGDRQLAVQLLLDDADLARERNALIARDIVQANLDGAPRQDEWDLVDQAQDRKRAGDDLRSWVDENDEE